MADMPGMGGSPPVTAVAPAIPAETTPPAAAPALPGGFALPPGLTLPPGFDPSSISPEQIGGLIGSLPPGFLESITSGGDLAGLAGGAGGLDLGMLCSAIP